MPEAIDWTFLYGEPAGLLDLHWSRVMWRCFSKYIPARAKVLEVGCGTGRISVQACRDLLVDAAAVDISTYGLEYAQRLSRMTGVECCFAQGSGLHLPFPDGCFDAVVSEGVIEHFSVQHTEQMVAEHARVCRRGGTVVISVPNLLNLPLTYHKARVGDRYHSYPERSYTVWGLASLLRRHGLKPIARDGFAPGIGFEWYILPWLRLRWLDRIQWSWLMALIGYEVLVAARKP